MKLFLLQSCMISIDMSPKSEMNSVMVNVFAKNSNTTDVGRAYLLNLMNLFAGESEEVRLARERRRERLTNFLPHLRWGQMSDP